MSTNKSVVIPNPELRGVLSEIVTDLQKIYPSLRLKDSGYPFYHRAFGWLLELGDQELSGIMGDAYPTGLIDSFVDIQVKGTKQEYNVRQRYDFGRERVRDFKGKIEGGSNNNPRPDTMWIAHAFAQGRGFNIEHYGHDGKYASSIATKITPLLRLDGVKLVILGDIAAYEEHGRAYHAPREMKVAVGGLRG